MGYRDTQAMFYNRKTRQGGFSLVVVLALVASMAIILTGYSTFQSQQNDLNLAQVSGWEGKKIARAARIYNREQIITRPNLINDLSTAAEEVDLSLLQSMSLLPPNFARYDSGVFYNSLNQAIHIFMANYPVLGDPNDVTTVPTIYVLFENGGRATPELNQHVVLGLRQNDVTVSAPLYNGTTNISDICNGNGPAVGLWDSGCLTNDDFRFIAGRDFAPGDFIIPAWRSVNFDQRAIMRFPQPERTGTQAMLTNLSMGETYDCASDPSHLLKIPSDSGDTDTTICDSISDDPSTNTDNRRSIININDLSANSLIISPQTSDDVSTNSDGLVSTTPDESYAFVSQGLLTVSGDTKVLSGDVNINNNLTADGHIIVSGPGTVNASATVGNTINTARVVTENFSVEALPTFDGDVSTSGNINNIMNINVTDNISTQTLTGDNSQGNLTINVNNNTTILGNLEVDDVTVTGNTADASGSYSFVAGKLTTRNLGQSGSTSVSGEYKIPSGSLVTDFIEVTNGGAAECFGDCPLRTEAQQCRNLDASGIINYDECMEQYR